jgi:hypothetical protein
MSLFDNSKSTTNVTKNDNNNSNNATSTGAKETDDGKIFSENTRDTLYDLKENATLTINDTSEGKFDGLIGGVNKLSEQAIDTLGLLVKGVGNFQDNAQNNLKLQTQALQGSTNSAITAIEKVGASTQNTKSLDVNQTTLIKYGIISVVILGGLYARFK